LCKFEKYSYFEIVQNGKRKGKNRKTKSIKVKIKNKEKRPTTKQNRKIPKTRETSGE
jgi:hypothetical protein